ncbi:MAG: hypothetical protein INR68_16650 [Methylobacterium mesophilicum]|nr:hypothetical protein [Methylobacterium mesophilicum]
MRSLSMLLACLMAGCAATPAPYVNELAIHTSRGPNTAPRGSEEFCRIYAAQTTVSRIEMSRNGHGGGANGFDRHLARQEGDRAFERCRAGRTN